MMDLKNKRVLVVGLGKSGLSAAMFLREQGARVTVSDTRSAVALAKEIPALLEAGIMVESGGHGLLTFRRQDLIVVSPGVPMDTPEVKQVVAFGLPDGRGAVSLIPAAAPSDLTAFCAAAARPLPPGLIRTVARVR